MVIFKTYDDLGKVENFVHFFFGKKHINALIAAVRMRYFSPRILAGRENGPLCMDRASRLYMTLLA